MDEKYIPIFFSSFTMYRATKNMNKTATKPTDSITKLTRSNKSLVSGEYLQDNISNEGVVEKSDELISTRVILTALNSSLISTANKLTFSV